MSNPNSHPNVTVEEASPESSARRTVTVEFLSPDCERCDDTESSLSEAVDTAAAPLEEPGVDIRLRYVRVESDCARCAESCDCEACCDDGVGCRV